MVHLDSRRDYRKQHGAGRIAAGQGEVGFQVVVEETDLWVVAEDDLSAEVEAVVRELRGQLKAYMAVVPEFSGALSPLPVADGAPEVVRRMAQAAQACGVGPMAAVAGTIAHMVAERLAPRSPNLLVENGGDLYMYSTKPRVIGLLADPNAGMRLGLALGPEDFPLSLCASSASIGHSLSFGQADLVVVRSPSGSMADAAATTLANRLRQPEDLNHLAAVAAAIPAVQGGVQGFFAQCQGAVALWGRLELAAL